MNHDAHVREWQLHQAHAYLAQRRLSVLRGGKVSWDRLEVDIRKTVEQYRDETETNVLRMPARLRIA